MPAAVKKFKLFKVCKELNVGIDTISSFLKEKGVKVSGPNTSISAEIHEEILNNFAHEKEVADQLHLRKEKTEAGEEFEESDLTKEKVLENFQVQPGYATPKIDVRGAVFADNKILLVQEISDGCWSMPGGWADVGDRPSEVAVREVFEESGFNVRPIKLVGVFDANRTGRPLKFYHAYKIIFLCELLGGTATPSHETPQVDFFPLDQLPPLSTNRTNENHLREILKHVHDADRKVYFD